MTERRFFLLTMGLVAALAATAALSLSLGSFSTHFGDLRAALAGSTEPSALAIGQFRLPRLVAAIAAGASLAIAGALLQAVIRNPLAEPGILGINAGAALAVVFAIVALREVAQPTFVATVAILGGLAAAALIYALAWRQGVTPERLVLSGIMIGALCGGGITLFSLQGDAMDVQRALRWTSGSLNGTTWSNALMVSIAFLALAPIAITMHRDVDAIALDTVTAQLIGLSIERTQLVLVAVAVVLASVSTAAVGIIAFVGLAAPHLARSVFSNRAVFVLPLAALFGALLCALADLAGRTVFAPTQYPAGLVCALLGGPYFLWVMWREQRRHG